MDSFIFILPVGVEKISQLVPLKLESVRHGMTIFMFDDKNNDLYEMHHLDEKYQSCIVDQSTKGNVTSGSVVQLTKFDPIYLIMSTLEKTKTKGKIQFDDLEMDNQIREVVFKTKKSREDIITKIKNIADVSDVDGVSYFRLNYEKTKEWLKDKILAMDKKMKEHHLPTKGCTDRKRLRYSYKLVSNYFGPSFEKDLESELDIKIEEGKENSEPPNKKTKYEPGTNEATEDYSGSVEVTATKKVVKQTRAEKYLAGADKKGQKSMLSFFQKKK